MRLPKFLVLHQAATEHDIRAENNRGADQPALPVGGHVMPDAGDEDVDERERQHEFPGEVHELIHAQARQRAANPDEDENDRHQLREKPDVGRNPRQERNRRSPAAEEQRDAEADDGEHAEIFAEEKQRELEAGVFREIAGDDFGFGFRQIERRAVGFRERRDEEQNESNQSPRREHMPVRDAEGVMVLVGDDVVQVERADDHHHGHGGKDERDFVADHLRDGAHRAEQRVFVAARPAGHENGNFHRAADGEEKQQAGVVVGHGHVFAERQHRVGEQHGNQHHHRREEMDDFVRRARHDVFLGEHFHAVGNELAEAGEADFGERNADAVGAVAVLDAADAFALENGGDAKTQRETPTG